jgi:hypothetical protein
MDRRRFLLTSVAGAFGPPPAVGTQEARKVARIFYLAAASDPFVEAFKQGLRELGRQHESHGS